MQRTDPFWKRAFHSVRQFLSRPIGGGAAASKSKKSEPAHVEPVVITQPEPPQPQPTQKVEQAVVPETATPVGPAAVTPVAASRPEPVPDTPNARQPMHAEVRRLWGHDFPMAAQGLDEQQVIKYVDALLARYEVLEKQQQQYTSIAALSEKAAIEADKAAEAIRARVRAQADAEAAAVIAAATRKTQDLLTQAKTGARESTNAEAERILAAARQRAAIIEDEAKRQAQMFLIRSRESISDDLQRETEQVCNRLASSIHQLGTESDRLQSQWREHTAEICQSQTFELEDGAANTPSPAPGPAVQGEEEDDPGRAA